MESPEGASVACDDEEISALKEQVVERLRSVYDPELGINVVDLGLVYGVDIDENRSVHITMTLTTPGCPMHDAIGEGVATALGSLEGISGGDVNLVWEPRWDPSMMTEAGKAALGYW